MTVGPLSNCFNTFQSCPVQAGSYGYTVDQIVVDGAIDLLFLDEKHSENQRFIQYEFQVVEFGPQERILAFPALSGYGYLVNRAKPCSAVLMRTELKIVIYLITQISLGGCKVYFLNSPPHFT